MANEIEKILKELEKLNSMKELDSSNFCEENGYADIIAKSFGKDELKPTQLRKVFHALKDIQRGLKSQPFDRAKILQLLPELAYASGRGLIPKKFYDLMKICLSKDKLKDENDFEKVMDFLTSILAYHKMRHA